MSSTRRQQRFQERFIPDESLDAKPVFFAPRPELPARMPTRIAWPCKYLDESATPVTTESEESAKSHTFSPANVS